MSTFLDLNYTIRDLIVELMDDYIDEVVKVGSLDDAYTSAMRETPANPMFCVVSHAGGDLENSARTFNSNNVWKHKCHVQFYIPVTGADKLQEHEDTILRHYDEFLTKMGYKEYCLGSNSKMVVGRAYQPETWKIRNQHYTRLTYRVDVYQHL